MGETAALRNDQLETGAFASLAFGVVGDAMGTPTEELEPEQIERSSAGSRPSRATAPTIRS